MMVRITGLTGKNEQPELRTEFLRSTRFSMLLCIFIGGLLILDGKTLILLLGRPPVFDELFDTCRADCFLYCCCSARPLLPCSYSPMPGVIKL